jgi:hypothetical protein
MRTTGSVVVTSLNLRDGPNGNIIDVLPVGTKVQVLQDSQDGWPLVLAESGATPEVGYLDAANVQWDQQPLDPAPAPDVPGAANAQLIFMGKTRAPCSSRFMMITGDLSITDVSGETHVFNVNTGGYGSSYRFTDGPTPPGSYSVIGPFPPDPRGMIRGTVGFKFELLPNRIQIPGGNLRGDFCIHPDGLPPGTLGCLGVAESDAALIKCRDLISGLIAANKSVKVVVGYESGILF